MTLVVDTSVWSLALRRDGAVATPEVAALREAIEGSDVVVTTGLVLQELLQGFNGPKDRQAIMDRFGALPLIQPDREDHVAAAEVRKVTLTPPALQQKAPLAAQMVGNVLAFISQPVQGWVAPPPTQNARELTQSSLYAVN